MGTSATRRRMDSWSVDMAGRALWLILLLEIGISPILGSAFTPRPFGEGSGNYLGESSGGYVLAADLFSLGGDEYNRLVGVAITLSTLALSAIAIFFGVLTFTPARLAATGLWLGSIALTLSPLLSSFFGTVPNPSLQTVAIPALFVAAFLLPRVSPNWFIAQAKRMLLVYAYGSLIAALVIPAFAIEAPYTGGLLPFLPIRLHGVAPHANILGTMMVLYLILNCFERSNGWRSSIHLVAVVATLVLAQSKTNWILLLSLFILYHGYRTIVNKSNISHLIVMIFLGSSSLLLSYFSYDPSAFHRISTILEDKDVGTLTGRTNIWSFTINIWRQNPIFGYGSEFFGTGMRLEYEAIYGWAPPHAHNQWYQTLGESGIIGIVTMNLYIIIISFYGLRYCKYANCVTLMIVIWVFVRSYTEVPFRTIVSDGNLFLHFLIFSSMLLISTSAQRREQMRPPRRLRLGQVAAALTDPVPSAKNSGIALGREQSAHL